MSAMSGLPIFGLYLQIPAIAATFSEKDIGKVFVIAVVLDILFTLIVHRWIVPGQALLVGTVLAIVPYVLIRGPVARSVRRVPRT